ncbi:hypothetical protein V6N11_077045 [Hibiscus sabdariffa]|uniref:Uncharacterized protein n=1 Tax=Hibiscus sabdariffa TaxID=183260 RepID=A0ABR2TC10_9ROSI
MEEDRCKHYLARDEVVRTKIRLLTSMQDRQFLGLRANPKESGSVTAEALECQPIARRRVPPLGNKDVQRYSPSDWLADTRRKLTSPEFGLTITTNSQVSRDVPKLPRLGMILIFAK